MFGTGFSCICFLFSVAFFSFISVQFQRKTQWLMLITQKEYASNHAYTQIVLRILFNFSLLGGRKKIAEKEIKQFCAVNAKKMKQTNERNENILRLIFHVIANHQLISQHCGICIWLFAAM